MLFCAYSMHTTRRKFQSIRKGTFVTTMKDVVYQRRDFSFVSDQKPKIQNNIFKENKDVFFIFFIYLFYKSLHIRLLPILHKIMFRSRQEQYSQKYLQKIMMYVMFTNFYNVQALRARESQIVGSVKEWFSSFVHIELHCKQVCSSYRMERYFVSSIILMCFARYL